jgi:hypothetical protein
MDTTQTTLQQAKTTMSESLQSNAEMQRSMGLNDEINEKEPTIHEDALQQLQPYTELIAPNTITQFMEVQTKLHQISENYSTISEISESISKKLKSFTENHLEAN